MTHRARLPNRRSHETVAIEMIGQRFKVRLGRAVTCGERELLGPITEIFLNAQKPNSVIDVLVNDGAILMSLLIQFGCPVETIAHAMKRNPDGSPASPFGFAADLLLECPDQSPGGTRADPDSAAGPELRP